MLLALDFLALLTALGITAISFNAYRRTKSHTYCADFIPDKNGDTWGACAEVEGYIAVEDWCTVWEHVSAEH